jgi:hypothetical protein
MFNWELWRMSCNFFCCCCIGVWILPSTFQTGALPFEHASSPFYFILFYLFLWYWGLNSGPTPRATPPAPFCDGYFLRQSLSWTVFPGLTLTTDPPDLCSWVARITGMSHWCLALFTFFIQLVHNWIKKFQDRVLKFYTGLASVSAHNSPTYDSWG